MLCLVIFDRFYVVRSSLVAVPSRFGSSRGSKDWRNGGRSERSQISSDPVALVVGFARSQSPSISNQDWAFFGQVYVDYLHKWQSDSDNRCQRVVFTRQKLSGEIGFAPFPGRGTKIRAFEGNRNRDTTTLNIRYNIYRSETGLCRIEWWSRKLTLSDL